MSAGKRYKWQGSTIKVMTGFAGPSPLPVITGISKTNPAVVTATAHGLITGDAAKIANVVGMIEVNDQLYPVTRIDANSFSLFGVDATGYTTYASGGTFDVASFSAFCELTNYDRQGGSSPEIPAETVCSTAAEFEIGLPDFGTTALSFNFAPKTTVQGALAAFQLSGDPIAVHFTLPKSGGDGVQIGFVQQESESAGNGGLWTAKATIRNTGQRFDF